MRNEEIATAERMEPISVKIPEAVRLSGISRSRIYELMRSGDIKYAKVGGSTLILVESLRHLILSRRWSNFDFELGFRQKKRPSTLKDCRTA